MREINFITIGDKNFFPFINVSIKQVLKIYPTSKFFIYDWGFTPSQKKKINTYSNTILIDWADKLDREHGYKKIKKTYYRDTLIKIQRKMEYLYNQKPFCILDCAKRIRENLIFFDGDVILINPIDEIFEDNYDIGLTVRFRKNILKGLSNLKWGINSGVIFFKLNSKPMQIFIQEWINEINTSDLLLMEQTSLVTLIKDRNKEIFNNNSNSGIIKISDTEFKIKAFPIPIYNFYRIIEGYNDKKVKILHFNTIKYYNPNLSKSLIIRDYIRQIKISYPFFQILKLVSPILSPKIYSKIRRSFKSFLIYRKKKRIYSF
ncbi:MAG: hypothetical protein EU529_06005 [Promethearchaeota archaeon]|nr:MAG: hypothetical protein EU529_06005 [Candidatus Lokiarchaeota archaeon]